MKCLLLWKKLHHGGNKTEDLKNIYFYKSTAIKGCQSWKIIETILKMVRIYKQKSNTENILINKLSLFHTEFNGLWTKFFMIFIGPKQLDFSRWIKRKSEILLSQQILKNDFNLFYILADIFIWITRIFKILLPYPS